MVQRSGAGLGALEQPMVRGEQRQLETTRDADLVEDLRQVMLHGVFAEREALGNRPVRAPPTTMITISSSRWVKANRPQ